MYAARIRIRSSLASALFHLTPPWCSHAASITNSAVVIIYGYAKPFYGSDDGNTPMIVGSARKQAFPPIKIGAADIGAAVVFEPVPGVAWICSRISLTGTRFDGRDDGGGSTQATIRPPR